MTYQIIDARSRKQIAWGLTLQEAMRYCQEYGAGRCWLTPVR